MNSLAHREAGTGIPLVLIHAYPLDSAMWQQQLGALSGAFRVLVPDVFGFGESPLPAEEWTMDSMAEAIAALLDRLAIEGKIILGGLSMGGYIALSFAKRYPDRLRGLILADTRADGDSPEAKVARGETIEFVRKHSAAAQIEKMLPKMLSANTQVQRADIVECVRTLGSKQSVPAVVAALAALRDRPDSTTALKSFDFPTLVMVGEQDAITPPALAEAMIRELKRGSLEVIPSAGHLSNLEAPEAFNFAVRNWLTTITALES